MLPYPCAFRAGAWVGVAHPAAFSPPGLVSGEELHLPGVGVIALSRWTRRPGVRRRGKGLGLKRQGCSSSSRALLGVRKEE